ncbi:zinc finger CCCH domain-containing protein 7 isoform X1 [Amborella trichopoda]|uniref:zinc finger CCCH domain-containing protein 7 isoform X1 n=1 Tax=Amborella trichopoda TaxID=13333 RepID=UPI0009BD92FF|nr:zinc finger CCCH domain-containing protein 7 isoform X1 [Amborella trichopoda]|eukprot:XP_020529202.1 zinc finger CCCH domain-containing protein 7 isoform X1 [Amborella trichopoda]
MAAMNEDEKLRSLLASPRSWLRHLNSSTLQSLSKIFSLFPNSPLSTPPAKKTSSPSANPSSSHLLIPGTENHGKASDSLTISSDHLKSTSSEQFHEPENSLNLERGLGSTDDLDDTVFGSNGDFCAIDLLEGVGQCPNGSSILQNNVVGLSGGGLEHCPNGNLIRQSDDELVQDTQLLISSGSCARPIITDCSKLETFEKRNGPVASTLVEELEDGEVPVSPIGSHPEQNGHVTLQLYASGSRTLLERDGLSKLLDDLKDFHDPSLSKELKTDAVQGHDLISNERNEIVAVDSPCKAECNNSSKTLEDCGSSKCLEVIEDMELEEGQISGEWMLNNALDLACIESEQLKKDKEIVVSTSMGYTYGVYLLPSFSDNENINGGNSSSKGNCQKSKKKSSNKKGSGKGTFDDKVMNPGLFSNASKEIVTQYGAASRSKDAKESRKRGKHGPLTEERKAKKKLAKKRQRAKKNKELGIKRLKLMPVTKAKPVVLCQFYMKGRCNLGLSCKFSHDTIPLTKSKPCKYLISNSCLKGQDCPYDHDLSNYPCRVFVANGTCLKGDKCPFSHKMPPPEQLSQVLSCVQETHTPDSKTIPEEKLNTSGSLIGTGHKEWAWGKPFTPPAEVPEGITFFSFGNAPNNNIKQQTRPSPPLEDQGHLDKYMQCVGIFANEHLKTLMPEGNESQNSLAIHKSVSRKLASKDKYEPERMVGQSNQGSSFHTGVSNMIKSSSESLSSTPINAGKNSNLSKNASQILEEFLFSGTQL